MPKMKTRKAVKKRFKVTAKGKLMRYGSGGVGHLLSGKSSKRKRKLKKCVLVDKGQVKMIARLMGIR